MKISINIQRQLSFAVLLLIFAATPITAFAQDHQNHQHHQPTPAPSSTQPKNITGVIHLLQDAEKKPHMALPQFEEFALANNPTLQQARQIVTRSSAQAKQAGLYPNPFIGYQGEEIRGGQTNGGKQGAFISQAFPLGGKLGLRRRVFEEQRKQDEIGVTEQRYRILSEVGQMYYNALASQELVSVRRNLLNLALDALETVHQLANVGQADAPDVLQTEVEAEQAKVEYNTAQYTYIQKFRELAALVGQPGLPLSLLSGDLEKTPAVDQNRIIETVLRDSPEVQHAQQSVVRAEAALRSAKREPVPDFRLSAGILQNNEPLDGIPSKPIGAQAVVSAGITLPIFNRNQGNIEAAKADLERRRQDVTRVQLSLRQRVQPLLQAYLSEQMQANRYRNEMIPLATRAYQLYLSKYQQMAAAYPQVIVSQRTLFQLRAAYIHSLEKVWSTAIQLQNFTLSGGLNAPMPAGSDSTSLNLPNAGGSAD